MTDEERTDNEPDDKPDDEIPDLDPSFQLRSGISRRDLLKRTGVVAGAVAIGGALAACGGDDDTAAAPAEPAEEPAAPAEEPAAPAEEPAATPTGGDVNWLSWPGHNDPFYVGPFEEQSGFTMQNKEYSGGDNMLALATTSEPGTFDVVQADAEYIPQLQAAGLLDPIDPAEFPDMEDYWDFFKPQSELIPGLVIDGQIYGIIQRFGFLGIAYNDEKVTHEEAKSYEFLTNDKVTGKVGWFDWWAHMGPIALWVGSQEGWWGPGELDPYNLDADQFEAMTERTFSLKPQTAGYYSIGDTLGAFANEEIWIQPAGGDWAAALLRADGNPISAIVPNEGAIQWTEALGIFKDAKNKEGAKEFLRYAMSPRGQVQTAQLPAYAAKIPSEAGWQLLNEENPEFAQGIRPETSMDLSGGENILGIYEQGLMSIRKLPVQQTIEDWADKWTEFKSL